MTQDIKIDSLWTQSKNAHSKIKVVEAGAEPDSWVSWVTVPEDGIKSSCLAKNFLDKFQPLPEIGSFWRAKNGRAVVEVTRISEIVFQLKWESGHQDVWHFSEFFRGFEPFKDQTAEIAALKEQCVNLRAEIDMLRGVRCGAMRDTGEEVVESGPCGACLKCVARGFHRGFPLEQTAEIERLRAEVAGADAEIERLKAAMFTDSERVGGHLARIAELEAEVARLKDAARVTTQEDLLSMYVCLVQSKVDAAESGDAVLECMDMLWNRMDEERHGKANAEAQRIMTEAGCEDDDATPPAPAVPAVPVVEVGSRWEDVNGEVTVNEITKSPLGDGGGDFVIFTRGDEPLRTYRRNFLERFRRLPDKPAG